MKKLLLAAILALPAALAAVPPRPPQEETPEMLAQLRQEAGALELQLRANPKAADLYMRLGFAYARLRQADDAQRAFEGALALTPGNADAHYMLGLIYEKKGLKDKAVAAWKSCLENTADPRMRDTAQKHLHHLTRP